MKALGLLSGGLDSALAAKLVQEQGIEVVAVNFTSPFCLCGKGGCGANGIAKQLGIPLKVIAVGEAYLQMLRNPKHGYGKNMNPCIDCRIFMFRKAKEYAEKIGAAFIFTGEVLGERPMSQHRDALNTIEARAGMKGRILRPLSAKLLPETEAEKRGWIDRNKLLSMRGRSRKAQISLAKGFNINGYPCPAGGCLLTYKEFAEKIRDLFEHKEKITIEDVVLLRVGRHFRFSENKIIVGRNKAENEQLKRVIRNDDYAFEVPDCGSPISLLQGPKTPDAIRIAASLTLHYSDNKEERALVRFGVGKLDKSIVVCGIDKSKLEGLRIK